MASASTTACDYEYVKKHSENYEFPSDRLQLTNCDPSLTPLVFVACGSFSPITFLHLRMAVMAKDHARSEGYEVIGGYYSPVSDSYKKKGLAPATHRIRMCELGIKNTKWLTVDSWEARNPLVYQPTARVLDHFDYEINEVLGGVQCTDGTRKRARITLLAGADLVNSFLTPKSWDEKDLEHILGNYGVFALERSGTDIDTTLSELGKNASRVHIIRQVVTNEVSSTKIRLLLKREMSIDYLIPSEVIEHIYQNNLYRDLDGSKSNDTATSSLG